MQSLKTEAKARLENLVRINQLKSEPGAPDEINGLINSAKPRLKDAGNKALSLESRFDLAYNAVHSLCLAGLRRHGYRSENRFVVFQCSPDTLDLTPIDSRILGDAHRKRNNAEYSGEVDVDEAIVSAMLRIGKEILKKLEAQKESK